MSSNKKDEKRSNPLSLLRNTGGSQPEITALPPSAVPAQEAAAEEHVVVQQEVKRPSPSAIRVRRDKPYAERYTKETISIDNRLLPYFYQLLETYPNNTIAVNDIVVKACIAAGLDIPDDLPGQMNPFAK